MKLTFAMALLFVRMVWDTARWAQTGYGQLRLATSRQADPGLGRRTMAGLVLLYVGYVALLAAVLAALADVVLERTIPWIAYGLVVATGSVIGIVGWMATIAIGRRAESVDPTAAADLVLALGPVLAIVAIYSAAPTWFPR